MAKSSEHQEPRRSQTMRLRAILIATALSGIFGGLIGAGAISRIDNGDDNGTASAPATSNATPQPGAASNNTSSASTNAGCLTAADVYEQVRPAIVRITSTSGQTGGTGTGIIFDKQGLIITNRHVVNGAANIEVQLSNGSTFSAKVVGSDPGNDLAVIKIDASGQQLTVADLGDSAVLRPGDPVLAIGN